MDRRFDDKAEALRDDIRTWLAANVPTDPMPDDPDAAFQCQRAWQRKMYDAGWVSGTGPGLARRREPWCP